MYLQQLEAGWHLQYDDARRLRLRRSWVAPSGDAALALCQRICAAAAALGLCPQLRLTGGHRVTVDLSTPALGLTELDLLLAARLDRLPKTALLSPAPLAA
ncbi:pterin-4-alpha-carbinolamine dehydratase [Micractinium conductrix]|uniref:4a-hydroxytetrahydrobiopterin dehydratase n=1 Tax=Micractinium conductrix TaxID=554055 RepID=A0A2P6VJ29_9CHLO|nr:pterin-4-alpha-carbinolamine dehydratase [Micractinium conductrix]|eukprot:PSC74113.1 pterin-4-alpha-carbinolamine dehydratase [Micractinium conductrix]